MTNICKGYYLSDIKNVGRFEYEEPKGKYYFKEIKCTEKAKDLCNACKKKEAKLLTYVLSPKNVLKVSLNGVAASHHNIFHRRIDEPIPPWSHAAGGIWDKEMENKGYSKEMVKTPIDETKLYQFISTLKGKKPEKIQEIMKQFPVSITRAAKYITEFNKNGLPSLTVAPSITQMIVSREKEEAFDIVELHLKKIEVCGKSYLYEPMKSKVYTIDYDYVGRYDSKEKRIFTEYPDSDAEPVLN